MKRFLAKVKNLIKQFEIFTIQQIPSSQNTLADALSKLATSAWEEIPPRVFLEELNHSCLEEPVLVLALEEGKENCRTPVLQNPREVKLPEDRGEAVRLQKR